MIPEVIMATLFSGATYLMVKFAPIEKRDKPYLVGVLSAIFALIVYLGGGGPEYTLAVFWASMGSGTVKGVEKRLQTGQKNK